MSSHSLLVHHLAQVGVDMSEPEELAEHGLLASPNTPADLENNLQRGEPVRIVEHR